MSDERASHSAHSDLETQISALEHLDLQGLREVWRDRWGAPPRIRSIDLLRRIIAWRIQAAAYGGLASDTRALLRSKSMPRIPLPKPGARLTREYKGILYTVEVGVGSVQYAGKAYGSLSAVAREITGVRWNGPRFFGLRPGP